MSEEKLCRDLQRHLDRTPVGFPATDSGVEIRILKRLFTPGDARLALCLSALPEPPSTIHKRVGKDISREALEAELDSGACGACGTCMERCQMQALSNDDGTTRLDVTRCIGCGLCVTTCPSGAIRLKRKGRARTPPKDVKTLYRQIFLDRYGPLGTLTAMGKKIRGLKV